MRLNLQTNALIVTQQAAIPVTHVSRQAPPLTLWVWLCMELLVFSDNHFVAGLALTWVCLALGVLRWAHWPRLSYPLYILAARLRAYAS